MYPISYVRESDLGTLIAKLRENTIYTGIPLSEYIVSENRLYVDMNNYRYCPNPIEGFEPFREVMYNNLVDIAIDIEKGVTKTDIVVDPRRDKLMLVLRDTPLSIVEAQGKRVYPLFREGDKVSINDKLFYIVTGKYEVRVVRSNTNGVVLYVSEVVPRTPQTFIMVICDESKVKWLELDDRCRIR